MPGFKRLAAPRAPSAAPPHASLQRIPSSIPNPKFLSSAIFSESAARRAPALLSLASSPQYLSQRQLQGNPSRRRTPVVIVHRPKGSTSTSSLRLPWGRPASQSTGRRRSPRNPRGHPGWPGCNSGRPARRVTTAGRPPPVSAAAGPQARPRGGVRDGGAGGGAHPPAAGHPRLH